MLSFSTHHLSHSHTYIYRAKISSAIIVFHSLPCLSRTSCLTIPFVLRFSFLTGVSVENGIHRRLNLLHSMAWTGECSMIVGRNSLRKVDIVISLQGTETLYTHNRTCGMENEFDLTKYRKSVKISALKISFALPFIAWSHKVPIVMVSTSFFS